MKVEAEDKKETIVYLGHLSSDLDQCGNKGQWREMGRSRLHFEYRASMVSGSIKGRYGVRGRSQRGLHDLGSEQVAAIEVDKQQKTVKGIGGVGFGGRFRGSVLDMVSIRCWLALKLGEVPRAFIGIQKLEQ